MSRLDDIEARANAATPGPWRVEGLGVEANRVSAIPVCGYANARADRDFIAHAREDIPYLVARVRVLQDALRDAIEQRYAGLESYTMSDDGEHNNDDTIHLIRRLRAVLEEPGDG